MTIYLRRRARFSAGFGVSNPSGLQGGHSYLCELMVGGTIDPQTGMVVNIRDVDAVLKSRVTSVLDGKILDRDIPAFHDMPPTPENLVRYLWEECRPALVGPGALVQVTLWPTPLTWVTLSTLNPPHLTTEKESRPMLTLTRAYDFSASHRLHSQFLSDDENAEIFGKCNWTNGHGHNYAVEVTVVGEPDGHTGEILPSKVMDGIVEEEVMRRYDHKHLNYDTVEFAELNPTSENLTRVIWDKLAPRFAALTGVDARLYRVIVRETDRNYFEYYGE